MAKLTLFMWQTIGQAEFGVELNAPLVVIVKLVIVETKFNATVPVEYRLSHWPRSLLLEMLALTTTISAWSMDTIYP